MVFVDTGGWFAAVVPTDADHKAAMRSLRQNRQPLITTDYVVDETLTLLKARGHVQRALIMGQQFFHGSLAVVHYLSPAEILLAWRTFQRFSDKEWNFTDCTSKVVIDALGLTHAFAFDHHFAQFGSVQVVP